MPIMKIITKPNKKLHTKCENIKVFNKETKDLANSIVKTLLNAKNPEGAGLAAPQVGLLIRMVVVRDFYRDKDDSSVVRSKEYVLANPVMVKQSKEKEIDWEGCLSIPDTHVRVERAKKIKVRAQDESGNKIQISTSGFFARVIQHEMDHLEGILITDKNRAIGNPIDEKEFEKLHDYVA